MNTRKKITKGYVISSVLGIGSYFLLLFSVFIFEPRGDNLELIWNTIGLPDKIAVNILRDYYGTLTSGYLLHELIVATFFYATLGALVYTIYLIFWYVKTKVKRGK